MKFSRRSGVLLHITSLPSPYGIGDLGEGAYRFVDFLVDAGQRLWEVLPLAPLSFGNSPYSCPSALAGNPLLISPEELPREGILSREDIPAPERGSFGRVDFGRAGTVKMKLLERAHDRFRANAGREEREALEVFCAENACWLDDYALYAALKERHQGRPWYTWPRPLAFREESAIKQAREEFAREIEGARFRQYLFSRQWRRLREYANQRGISIIGDLPFFVNHDSVDVWVRRQFFLLDAAGRRLVFSGVPPSRAGVSQIWDMPLYNWEAMADAGFPWWSLRFSEVLGEVDIVRVDHFSGFFACWHVDAGARTSAEGRWVLGPGASLFRSIEEELGPLPLIAESMEPRIKWETNELLTDLGYPGIRILQHGFHGRPDNPHLPKEYPEQCAAYTGTHDDDTIIGWFAAQSPGIKKRIRDCLGTRTARGINWKVIEAVLQSAADTVIIPLQDVLGLGSEARMNLPGAVSGQWEWRYRPEMITAGMVKRFLEYTRSSGR